MIFSAVFGIALSMGIGVGACSFFTGFHNLEIKFDKRGEKNASTHSKHLRKKSEELS
jgi:hypothetical protein